MTHSFADLTDSGEFTRRHIGLDDHDRSTMLAALGLDSSDQLLDEIVPESIRLRQALDLPGPRTEVDVIAELREIAGRNEVFTSLIGQGYYGTITPPVIQRNVLENPAWYTAYTPYQPEISQGRLEALLNFQTMVADLTGMDLANASMLDEATAAAEAMTMARRLSKVAEDRFFIHADVHPQTRAVIGTRAEAVGIELVSGADPLAVGPLFGALLPLPGSSGALYDWSATIGSLHAANAVAVVATDLLASVLITPAGEMGADIAVGSAQRFGVPMGFGGPHAGFLACRQTAARSLPGRLVGVSTDTNGRPALRLALQTREQHIRREKATSNICTAQVLLANIAGFYAAWHGPHGLRTIAERVHRLTSAVAGVIGGVVNESWFDTITVAAVNADAVVAEAAERRINLRRIDDSTVGLSFDETSTGLTARLVVEAFGGDAAALNLDNTLMVVPPALRRSSAFLQQQAFNRHHSEHEMLRYLRRLSDKDLAMDRTMIPLGSCTMKLNATSEMIPITWPEFANVHPFAPESQSVGYRQLIDDLERMLAVITGYDRVSLQPNAGSQGELAGLLAIRAYHLARGDGRRTVCLIPSSAHGTNAASAVMAGMRVVVVRCDEQGNVDIGHLTELVESHREDLAAVMITYPSTHGVFEERIADICVLIHAAGGQVYIDGANLNALVGVAQPGRFGGDVSHLNLHKTFCIPHGGGGPGVGPVAVRSHLAPFLPGSAAVPAISAAPVGSAMILPISWVYIALMGAGGLKAATTNAMLAANYVAERLHRSFPVLYRGERGRVAHECILDLRDITRETGVTVEDVAKRLMDFGFHAPTISFPVAGTLMIEPTESESLREIDRFCAVMIEIRDEIDRIVSGEWPEAESPLRHAPHTAADLLADDWNRPYSRAYGAYGRSGEAADGHKYFPPVSRIDAAFGDRNLVCSCEPLESFTG